MKTFGSLVKLVSNYDVCLASTEVKWSNGRAEICYRVEALLMGAESVTVSLWP